MTTRTSKETAEKVRQAWPGILADVAAGLGIAEAITSHGVKTEWARAFRASEPGADAEWQRAKEESAEALMDELLAVARTGKRVELDDDGKPLIVRIDPASARVHVDTLRWAMSKRNPRVYSDKAQLDVNVRTVDLTRIIEAANARLLAGRGARVLEHQVSDAGVIELVAPKVLADLV